MAVDASDDSQSDEAPVYLDGPPEPVVPDDETVLLVEPSEDGRDITTIELGAWECQRCDGGTIVETAVKDGELQEPGACPGCERNGPYEHVGGIDEQQVQEALRAQEQWRPPSDIEATDFQTLWAGIREFIYDHWDTDDPAIYNGLTAYAITTWVREDLEFLPHLMLMGKTTGGKTRLLNTLARVSYRGMVSASATPASMYRLIDAYDITYYVSEYHGLDPDTKREVDNVVRAGQKRGEVVTRAEQSANGFEPKVYDPFTHMAVASQYEPADDIVNRCIQVHSSSMNREMPPTVDDDRATELRNQLLYTRFRLLESQEWADAETEAYLYLDENDIDGRTREKLLAIVTVAHLFDTLEEIEPFVEDVVEQDQEAAHDSEDARFVEIVRDLAFDDIAEVQTIGDANPWGAVEIPYTQIVEEYEARTGTEHSPSWAGHVRKRLDLGKERKRDGTVIQDPELDEKLQRLCDDLELDWESSDLHDPVPELPDDEKGPGAAGCPHCGRDRTLTHKDAAGSGARICSECADDIRAAEEE